MDEPNMTRSTEDSEELSTTRRRENRRGDEVIQQALPRLSDELSMQMTHQGRDYLSETPAGHRRLVDNAVERLGTLIQQLFYFDDLSAGALGDYHGRGVVEAGFRKGTQARLEYVRSELECFHPEVRFRSAPEPTPALHFELYYDREEKTWLDEAGQPLACSTRIWREDPDRDPDRRFP